MWAAPPPHPLGHSPLSAYPAPRPPFQQQRPPLHPPPYHPGANNFCCNDWNSGPPGPALGGPNGNGMPFPYGAHHPFGGNQPNGAHHYDAMNMPHNAPPPPGGHNPNNLFSPNVKRHANGPHQPCRLINPSTDIYPGASDARTINDTVYTGQFPDLSLETNGRAHNRNDSNPFLERPAPGADRWSVAPPKPKLTFFPNVPDHAPLPPFYLPLQPTHRRGLTSPSPAPPPSQRAGSSLLSHTPSSSAHFSGFADDTRNTQENTITLWQPAPSDRGIRITAPPSRQATSKAPSTSASSAYPSRSATADIIKHSTSIAEDPASSVERKSTPIPKAAGSSLVTRTVARARILTKLQKDSPRLSSVVYPTTEPKPALSRTSTVDTTQSWDISRAPSPDAKPPSAVPESLHLCDETTRSTSANDQDNTGETNRASRKRPSSIEGFVRRNVARGQQDSSLSVELDSAKSIRVTAIPASPTMSLAASQTSITAMHVPVTSCPEPIASSPDPIATSPKPNAASPKPLTAKSQPTPPAITSPESHRSPADYQPVSPTTGCVSSAAPAVVKTEDNGPFNHEHSAQRSPFAPSRTYVIPARQQGCSPRRYPKYTFKAKKKSQGKRRSKWSQTSWIRPRPLVKYGDTTSESDASMSPVTFSPSLSPKKPTHAVRLSFFDSDAENKPPPRAPTPPTVRQMFNFRFPIPKTSAQRQSRLGDPLELPGGSTSAGASQAPASMVAHTYDLGAFDEYVERMWGSRNVSKFASGYGSSSSLSPRSVWSYPSNSVTTQPPFVQEDECDVTVIPTRFAEGRHIQMETTATKTCHISSASRDPVGDLLRGVSEELVRSVKKAKPAASPEPPTQYHSPLTMTRLQSLGDSGTHPPTLPIPVDPPTPVDSSRRHLPDSPSVDMPRAGRLGGFGTTSELYTTFNTLLGHHIEMLKLLPASRECEQLDHLLEPALDVTANHLDSLHQTLILAQHRTGAQ